MRILKIVLIVLCCGFTFNTMAQTNYWMVSIERATELSVEKQQPLLIFFSGSDWCKPCIKLKKEVLDTEAFQSKVKNKWVLYNADFPYKKKLDEKLVARNEELAEKYNKKGKFPLVVLVLPNGEVIAEGGYKKKSVDEYIAYLEEQIK